MFKLTVEGETLDELKANLAAAAAGIGGKAPAAPKGGQATTAPKEEAPAAEEDDGSEGITYEEVSALTVRLSKEKGRDTAINFLKGFKNPANGKPATKGAEIAPKDYPKAKADAEALLAEEDDVS